MFIGYDHSDTFRTLEEYALLLESSFQSNIPGDIFTSASASCGVTAVECVYQIFNVLNDNQETSTIVASLDAPNGHYRIMITTFTTSWEKYSATMFEVLHSFSLI